MPSSVLAGRRIQVIKRSKPQQSQSSSQAQTQYVERQKTYTLETERYVTGGRSQSDPIKFIYKQKSNYNPVRRYRRCD